MTKVYPNSTSSSSSSSSSSLERFTKPASDDGNVGVKVLTVWKKSLLFNCNGFTVFDGKGNLFFRVDNYVSSNKGEIVLMDAAGKSLLTIRRKRLSLGDNWLVYEGETAVNPLFSVKKHVNLLNSKSLAHVIPCSGSGGGGGGSNKNVPMYWIEGSYAQRCCAVYDGKRKRVAEIKRKEAVVGGAAFGNDVFRLIVEPEIDPVVAMSLVILLDQMFRST